MFEFEFPTQGILKGLVSLEGSFSVATPSTDLYTNPHIGMHSLIQSVRIQRGGEVLEDIREYGRVMAAITAGSMSSFDYCLSSLGQLELRAGTTQAQSALIGNSTQQTPVNFSIVPLSGILQHAATEGLNLAQFAPLRLVVELAQDRLVLAGSGASGNSYQLSDVSINYYVDGMDMPAPKKPNPIVFRSYHTVAGSIRSSYVSLSTDLRLPAVLSAFQSYISNVDLSDATKDAYYLEELPNLESIDFKVGGMSFPYSEPLRPSTDEVSASVLGAIPTLSGMDAIKGSATRYSGPGPLSLPGADFEDAIVTGVRYDEPVDFMKAGAFGLVIDSGASASNPFTVYMTFVHESLAI